jgi:hypothetical protein
MFLLAIPIMTFFLNRGPVSNLQRDGENRGDGEKGESSSCCSFRFGGAKMGSGVVFVDSLFCPGGLQKLSQLGD